MDAAPAAELNEMAEAGVVEVQMPQMGESVTEGTILEWRVSEGQEVAEGDTVVEVSTDKIDAEVPAPASGVVTNILAQPDDTVEVGQVLAKIDPNGTASSGNGASADPSPLHETEGLVTSGGEGDQDLGDDSVGADSADPGEVTTAVEPDAEPSADPDAADQPGETLVISMPEMGESVTEGTILEWHVAEGQGVAEGDTVIEVSTDKIDAEVPAPAAGTITKLLVEPDDDRAGRAGDGGDGGRARRRAGSGERAAAPSEAERERAPRRRRPRPGRRRTGGCHPVARRVAAAKGVDLSAVEGSGPGGKVTKEDVLAAANGDRAARGARAGAPRRGEAAAGPPGMLAKAMNESRQMPTATSFRTLAGGRARRKAQGAQRRRSRSEG